MNKTQRHPTHERLVSLHTDQVQRLHSAAHLRVVLGTVWLTVTRDPHDHVLVPGDQFTLERGSDAVVQALAGRACFVVSEPAPHWTQRASATLQSATQRFAGLLA